MVTLGDVLAARRRCRFVGRTAETELFRVALDDSPFSVLHVHGPGGIGKSSLLEVLATAATEAGACPVRLDGREVHPSPAAVLDLLAQVLDVPPSGPIGGPTRLVLLVDGYERLAVLDDWLRTELLPRLPGNTLTVLAGRRAPTPAWRADPAWSELLRVLSLRNWDGADSRRFLEIRGVAPALHDRIVAVTHGHPLALALLADLVARGGELPVDGLDPDLIATLLRRIVDAVPDARQRRALEVCALARVTTEALLRAALDAPGGDAAELFGWLRELSFVEAAPDGLVPHDLARDVLDVDLRWRDPEGYRRTFRAVREHVHGRARAERGRAQQSALFDEKFLFRNLPGILSPVDWRSWGRHYPEPARPGDHAAVVDLVRTAEGARAAAVAARWLTVQPDAFWVQRRGDGAVRGVLALLDLTRASADEIAADPATSAAWAYGQRHGPPRPGETVTQTRFVIDADTYQGPSPTMNAAPVLTIQRYLATPRQAWDFLTLAEPDRWDEYFAIADLPRAQGADFTVGGRRFGLFAHDFRRTPVDAWLELVTERALVRDFTLPPTAEPFLLPLAEADFAEAVRQGLRDLRRPGLLARNPLLRTRLLAERAADRAPDADVLAAVLREAVGSLAEHPRDDRPLRALDRTYLRPAATQERAAEVLGLPFSTYRRHLTAGVARVVAWLWEREVYGEQR